MNVLLVISISDNSKQSEHVNQNKAQLNQMFGEQSEHVNQNKAQLN